MKGPPPYRFEGLAAHTREEVRLWNWFCRSFPGYQDWQAWVSEVFGELLARPGARQLVLLQTYSLQPQQDERELVIEKEEYRLGRGADNDLVLPATAIATNHARIFLEHGQYLLEDLGSSLGTYVDRKRLQARQPHVLRSGDRFTMFPYSFTVRCKETWIPELQVRVSSPRARSMTWEEFRGAATADAVAYFVLVHPIGKAACLEARRSFLSELVNLLLQPLGLEGAEAGITPSDDGLLEFVLLSVIERANRGLRFPLQYALASCSGPSRFAPDSRGIALAFSMQLSGLTEAFRLYLPYELLESMEAEAPAGAEVRLSPAISFHFTASAGYVELTADELRRVEPSDILLFTSDGELLFPGDFSRGWKAASKKDNPWTLEIDNYFERSVLMDDTGKGEQAASGQAVPDFSRLTIRLHVVLGEKELTLTEANGLVRGTILELDRSKTDPVQLAINGKIVGDGELVDVDGRLGVRILSWRVT